MSEKELEPSRMENYFAGFVIQRLGMIYEAWDEGNVEQALQRTVKLVFFLPRDVKAKLSGDVEAIRKDLKSAYRVKSYDFFTTQMRRNDAARRVAQYWFPPFLDKVTDLCDEKGYFEQTRARPQRPSKGKMGVPKF